MAFRYKLTPQEIAALGRDGWRVYDSESVKYDYIAVRERDGKTVTRHIKKTATEITTWDTQDARL